MSNRGAAIELFDACVKGNVIGVERALQNGAAVEARNGKDWSPLIVAAKGTRKYSLKVAAAIGSVKVVQELLDAGADVEISGIDGYTPLVVAAAHGHAEVVKLLVEHKANVDAKQQDGSTGLSMACQLGFLDIAVVFLQHGADVNIINDEGWTPLMNAAVNGHPSVVRHLLESGATVNAKGPRESTALRIAAEDGQTDVIRELINIGAHIDEPSDDGITPLFIAARNGHSEIGNQWGQSQPTVKLGATALLMAAMYNRLEPLRILLDAGADVDVEDDCWWTVLSVAILAATRSLSS
ncbi:Ankyrin repeat-containing domain [Phytophthora cactorum]|nr:Ankyrin repeat-containing domain [Phytophthora cactorum]